MKKLSLAFLFVCCTMTMSAQNDYIKVNYNGAKPTIKDFAWSFLKAMEAERKTAEECDRELYAVLMDMKDALERHNNGLALDEGVTITIDQKNGYLLYEDKEDEFLSRIEMCYWNESDQKHKLFACNRITFKQERPWGGQYDGIEFYRYNNATKKMTSCDRDSIGVNYNFDVSDSFFFSLPHYGKDITAIWYNEKGQKMQKALKWYGHKFSY